MRISFKQVLYYHSKCNLYLIYSETVLYFVLNVGSSILHSKDSIKKYSKGAEKHRKVYIYILANRKTPKS